MKLPYMDALGSVGFVGERKALALLCLGFYTTMFFMIGLSARTELPEWVPVFSAMTVMYAVTFFAVAAEWFWGRWVASGIGYWGMTMALMVWVTQRTLPPAMIIFGTMHALVLVSLMGEKMAAVFDAKPNWRARWKIDDQGVIRVRKSVTRAASSLPVIIMYTLAPRDGQEMLALAACALVVVGLGGVLVSRTFGVLAIGAGGLATLALSLGSSSVAVTSGLAYGPLFELGTVTPLLGPLAAALAVGAVLPFARPMAAYVLRRR